MIRKEKAHISGLVDKMVVKEGYIITSSKISSMPFSDQSKINGRHIDEPYLGIFKLHRNHPLEIRKEIDRSSNYIGPALKKDRKGMPAKIYGDKLRYDLSSFFLVPADIDTGKSGWKKLATIDEAFVTEKDKKPISLIYLDHGWSLNWETNIAHPIMQTQIPTYFYMNFLLKDHKIYSSDKSFNKKLEGRIQIPLEKAKNIVFDQIIPLLEGRYKSTFLGKR